MKTPDPNRLLGRAEFKEAVFAASNGKCVLCQKPAVDAHHIMDRKLFDDGGYRLNNGAGVCNDCHFDCETTRIDVETVIAARGLSRPLLPAGFNPGLRYDKWGNQILENGTRLPGSLFDDDGCRRALLRGNVLHKFTSFEMNS